MLLLEGSRSQPDGLHRVAGSSSHVAGTHVTNVVAACTLRTFFVGEHVTVLIAGSRWTAGIPGSWDS